MHRSYRPVKPAQNKYLQHRWDNDDYEEHRRKVFEARPTVDSRPPQTYMHLHLKLKKLQLEEDRIATIERDNRILLQKMSHIMKTKGGRVDNENGYESKSLNREKRVRDLLRVTDENQRILKRITEKRPQYDHNEWHKEWETNQQYMDQIAAYPKEWWKKTTDESSAEGSKTEADSKSNNGKPEQTKKKTKKKTKRKPNDVVDKEQEYRRTREYDDVNSEAEAKERGGRKESEEKTHRRPSKKTRTSLESDKETDEGRQPKTSQRDTEEEEDDEEVEVGRKTHKKSDRKGSDNEDKYDN